MIAVMILLACGGDADSNDGSPTADTGPVVYEATWDGVQQLFADHCDSCHPATNGIDLRASIDTYVVANDPDASRLMIALRAESISTMMPPSGRLPDAQVDAVEAWILAGAPR